jgi:hypothetical protein
MGTTRIIGIVLIVVGAGIAYSGYDLSQTVGNQIGSAFSGSPSDNVMIRYVAGAASAAVSLPVVVPRPGGWRSGQGGAAAWLAG